MTLLWARVCTRDFLRWYEFQEVDSLGFAKKSRNKIKEVQDYI